MVWLFRFYWLVFQSWTGFSNSAGGLVVHASTSPTKRLAWDTDITGDVQWRTCQFSEMGRGSTQEPPWRPIETYGFCTVVAIWIYFGHLRMVQLHQNCLQSKGVESFLQTEFRAGSTNFPVRFYWIVCAREMHSTTEIRNDVSEQVCVFVLFFVVLLCLL